MALGLFLLSFHLSPRLSAVVLPVLALPAILDWTTQALGFRESQNWLRLATGAAFGLGGASWIGLLIGKAFIEALAAVALLALPVAVAMYVLKRSGAADRLVAQLEADSVDFR